MDLNKSYEFFKPETIGGKVHIIGCGSVGSTVAENLARCGVSDFVLWDFDRVESHNICNQMFREADISKPKCEALKEILLEINPELEGHITLKPKGWDGNLISGYIFLCVDSMEIRREIVQRHKESENVKAFFDFRTLLEGAQHYAADWSKLEDRENFLKTMSFSTEEAKASTPISACGMVLGVATTVRIISALGVNNFINFVKGMGLKKLVLMDGFSFQLDAF